ncbi:Wall-associated receptor kinase 3 [Triticum urartu]|uniref:Wall-associated receptor kinase 3 n=2 Tax=Triticum urartu TaxID=4572 RepID=M7ZKG4_TRIUA|nr:Wall-associated receptor kinase 3 [Triticum urartu]
MPIPSQLLPFLLAAAAAALLILPAIAEQRGLEEQEQQQQAVVERPVCQEMCGNISIPFPFGMGKPGCFLPGFEVTCNTSSSHAPRLFLAYNISGPYQKTGTVKHTYNTSGTGSGVKYNAVELMDISVGDNEARIYSAVSSDCSTSGTRFLASLQDTILDDEGPFLLSVTRNVVIGVGSNVESMMKTSFGETGKETKAYMPSCLSNLMGSLQYATNGTCSGLGCCLASLPLNAPPLTKFGVSFMSRPNYLWKTNPCFYSMLVEKSRYNFSTHDLNGSKVLYPGGAPVVLNFTIRSLGWCPSEGQQQPPGYACVSGNSTCVNTTRGNDYVCKCLMHYHGNPYITDGCHDINECKLPDLYPCSVDGVCGNRLEGYDCPCKEGMKGDGKTGHCVENFPLAAKVVVGLAACIVALVLMVMAHQLLTLKRFHEQNGGPVLKGVKNIKIYRRKEMKQITNNYSRVIGEGNFGKVYMGTLENKQQVAIKRSIKVDKNMKAEFTGEVIVQSEMRHKNIARLLGCCLELDVPMLVYEYVPRGSLYDALFGLRRVHIIPVDMRLQIAAGSAEGLTYMHSAGECTIRHGDVKSANILLDENFCPKVSDFGTSRLLAGGKPERTERVVGDMSYIDPIYMVQGIVTQKSDVYSFGVVLIELITRRPATYSNKRNYVASFVEAYLDKRARNLIDNDITSEVDIKLLEMVSGVAVECVKLNPEERLDMKQVEHRLLEIIGQGVQDGQRRNYQADLSPAPDDVALLKSWGE